MTEEGSQEEIQGKTSTSSPIRSSIIGMRQSPARTLACVVLLWAVFWYSLGDSSRALDSDLVETETGWQFEEDTKHDSIEVFNGPAPAPAPPAKLPSNHIYVLNSDFELTTVSGNATVLADVTATNMIPNWLPGGAGVQILQSSTYQMSSFAPGGVFAIHLNNPSSTGNSTQGSIESLNLTANPKPATLYTVQYDCARMPDGPLNLLTALRVSSMTGLTVNYFTLHKTRYNLTDTQKQITWIRQSFLFMGTGAKTSILFESMSEKYGPIVDNVVLMQGVHILHNSSPLPASKLTCLWQRMCPIFTVFFLIFCVQPEASL